MKTLTVVWQHELEQSGFCYDALGRVEAECMDRLRNHPAPGENERIAWFVIARICLCFGPGPAGGRSYDRVQSPYGRGATARARPHDRGAGKRR